ncbi:Eisosome component PIL1-domain-containing protein, partial [Cunninghamella echinulata]
KYQQYRHAIKSIRDREDRLSDIREKKRTLQSRISNLAKTSPKSPKLRELQKELGSLDRDTHDAELEMGDFKRFALKEAFYIRFNAMNEYAEKTAMIAGFGKYIVDLLDIAPTPATEPTRRPYEKGQEAAMIYADAMNAINTWEPREGDERPTIAANTNPLQHHASLLGDQLVSDEQATTSTSSSSSNVNNEQLEEEDDEKEVDIKGKGKGKESVSITTTLADQQQNNEEEEEQEQEQKVPPQLPPRSPQPTPIAPTGYSTDAVASVTSDHKANLHESEELLEQLDLYDAPPPAYEASQQENNTGGTSPRNSDEKMVAQDAKQRYQLHDEPIVRVESTQSTSSVSSTPVPAPVPVSSTSTSSKEQQQPTTTSNASRHEDKELIDESNESGFQTPYQAHNTLGTPSTPHSNIIYQQSPQPMHYTPHASPHPMYQQPHRGSTASTFDATVNWNIPSQQQQNNMIYGGVQPVYHQGQYQQLYDQMNQKQQQVQASQVPYTEFRQQFTRKDAGGFRIPQQQQHFDPEQQRILSADEEKRRLAERYAAEEAQARQASILSFQQDEKPLPPKKQSVIKPEEPENPGYKANKKRI